MSKEIYSKENINKPSFYNKPYFIYNGSNKNNIYNKESQKMNELFIRSHEYLSTISLLDSSECQNNIFDEYSTIKPKPIKITKRNKDLSQYQSLFDNTIDLKNFLENLNEGNNIIVTDLSYTFYGCSSLVFISGLSKFNIHKALNMAHMFENCSSLKKLLIFLNGQLIK